MAKGWTGRECPRCNGCGEADMETQDVTGRRACMKCGGTGEEYGDVDQPPALTDQERDKIRHALGWPKDYRNHFVTDADGPDGLIWRGLVERGLATASKPCDWMSGMTVYRVSEAGRAALAAKEEQR